MDGLRKPFRNKSDPKNRKNNKNQCEIAECEQKTTSEKAKFVQTPFSHSTLKLERKNFRPQNHSLFRFTSCFGDQNHYSNLTSKIMKMCEQILQKKYNRTSPEIQFKELNEKLRSNLPDQQIN